MRARMTVARVYKITEGSALVTSMTSGSPATGGNIAVEAVTDFDIPTDGETRTVLIGTEQITYTDVDEDTDELLNITRGANSTTAASHDPGDFVQYGVNPKRHKLADGFIDDDDSMAIGVEIQRHLWRFYPAGARDNDEMEIASVEFLDDGHPIIVDAPEDEDRATDPIVVTWTKQGVLSTGTRVHRLPMPFGGSIEEVRATTSSAGAPVGSSIIVDILVDGASILTDKIIIAAGETISDRIEPTDKFHENGQIVQIEIEQVGSTTPGSNLTVYVVIFPAENATAGRIEVPGIPGEPGADGADGADGVISEVQNEGSALADQSIMNFTGAGVDVTVAGGKYVVDIPGSGGTHDATLHTFIGAQAFKNGGDQSVTTATWTVIALQAEDFDTHAFHDNTTNNSRMTIPSGKAGKYRFLAQMEWQANATGDRHIKVLKNGDDTNRLGMTSTRAVAANTPKVQCTGIVELAVGDYLEMFGYQDSGGNLNALSSAAGQACWFAVEYLGA